MVTSTLFQLFQNPTSINFILSVVDNFVSFHLRTMTDPQFLWQFTKSSLSYQELTCKTCSISMETLIIPCQQYSSGYFWTWQSMHTCSAVAKHCQCTVLKTYRISSLLMPSGHTNWIIASFPLWCIASLLMPLVVQVDRMARLNKSPQNIRKVLCLLMHAHSAVGPTWICCAYFLTNPCTTWYLTYSATQRPKAYCVGSVGKANRSRSEKLVRWAKSKKTVLISAIP
jgi:hypothetical protein